MNKIATDYVSESNGKFTVHSHTGKPMGTYATRAEADKRLGQVEYFKKHAAASDMDPGEIDRLRDLLDKFFAEERNEAEHAEQKIAAGVIIQAPTGKVLLLLRAADEPNWGGHWGLPGGKAEEGETPEQAAVREVREETGIDIPESQLERIGTTTTPNGFEFVTFRYEPGRQTLPTPVLTDGEHDDFKWVNPYDPPEKIHPGVLETLAKLFPTHPGAADALALDKDSVRTFDDAGRMHVASAHISKACVSPYYGTEIPGWQELGLDPEHVYQLFRDPAELKKAASTFDGIQVLIRHIPVSADEPQTDEIVGTTGTSASFNAPYLDNELIIWSRDGINAIESGNQKELSCGYAYTPVMEPGEFNGEHYDGRMTDIKGNHVALVAKGRAGPDVVVGDSALEEPGWSVIERALLSLGE